MSALEEIISIHDDEIEDFELFERYLSTLNYKALLQAKEKSKTLLKSEDMKDEKIKWGLMTDMSYQSPVKENQVKRILKNFDKDSLDAITVNLRPNGFITLSMVNIEWKF